MKIGIIGSMQHTEQMVKARDELRALGHEAFLSDLHETLLGKSDEEKEEIKLFQKNEKDAIRAFWRQIILNGNLSKIGI